MTRETPAQVVARIAADSASAIEGLRAEVAQLRAELAALRAELVGETPDRPPVRATLSWVRSALDDNVVRVVVIAVLGSSGSEILRQIADGLRPVAPVHQEDTTDARPDSRPAP